MTSFNQCLVKLAREGKISEEEREISRITEKNLSWL